MGVMGGEERHINRNVQPVKYWPRLYVLRTVCVGVVWVLVWTFANGLELRDFFTRKVILIIICFWCVYSILKVGLFLYWILCRNESYLHCKMKKLWTHFVIRKNCLFFQ